MHIKEELLWSYLHEETDEENNHFITDHLRNCAACRNRLLAMENEEQFFQNIDYPMPSDHFGTLTSTLVLSKTSTKKRAWATIFKICLTISLILILVLSVWIVTSLEINLTIPDKTATIALYALPLVLLVFLMNTFEKRLTKY